LLPDEVRALMWADEDASGALYAALESCRALGRVACRQNSDGSLSFTITSIGREALRVHRLVAALVGDAA
jgi:hypothetical protein